MFTTCQTLLENLWIIQCAPATCPRASKVTFPFPGRALLNSGCEHIWQDDPARSLGQGPEMNSQHRYAFRDRSWKEVVLR